MSSKSTMSLALQMVPLAESLESPIKKNKSLPSLCFTFHPKSS